MPVVLVALFVVAACAASLAHARPGEPETCTAAKIGLEPVPTTPGDLAVLLTARAGLEPPRCSLSWVSPEWPVVSPHEALSDIRHG